LSLKPYDSGLVAVAVVVGFWLLDLLFPAVGQAIAWLAATALLAASPFLLFGVVVAGSWSRGFMIAAAVAGIALAAVLTHPFSFAGAISYWMRLPH